MNSIGNYDVEHRIGVITIDNPPVNALGFAARHAIDAGIRLFASDNTVDAVVIQCAGRTFFAGADISEFGQPPRDPQLRKILQSIESMDKPVVAAIHGNALGGGLELALVCHYRIAVPSAKLGLPEVNLGLIPGAGGTQRLPRIVGIDAALKMTTSGKPVTAGEALNLGLIDALATEGNLRANAVAFARSIVAADEPLLKVRERQEKVEAARGHPELFEAFLSRNAKAFRGLEAPLSIVKAIQAAAELSFEDGIKIERAEFERLVAGNQSAALRHYFFAERETMKVPDVPATTPTLPIERVGVVGAGTMGGGIAMCLANAGLPVTLVETSQEALDRGLATIRRNYEISAAKGRISHDDVERRMALLAPSLDLAALFSADLVIEAVFEEIGVKKSLFAAIDEVARPGAILASNTSFLDLNEIASVTTRPQDVVGLHFFSPANVMRLLEVVRGTETRKEVVATAMTLSRRLGKVPVVAGVCHGFIANRVMSQRSKRAEELVLQGPTPEQIDRALYDFGFAMGPFQMIDLVGLDVMTRDSAERSLRGDFVAADRLGQKRNGGFYDYDEKRRPTPSPVAHQIISAFSAANGVEQLPPLSDEEIVARLLFPVVNEGARVLEEGIALRASDIDVACILGYNWPSFTGGPMFWAQTVGLQRVIDSLRTMGIEPAGLLVEKAAIGDRL